MDQQKYLTERVVDQINWYEKKSKWNKQWFMTLKIIETVLALLIPLLTGFIVADSNTDPLKITIGSIGVVVAATANLITLFKFHENWIQYRTVTEMLKHEKFLFITKAGPYKEGNSFSLFVQRIESFISKENSQWASYIMTKEENGH